MRQPAVAVPRPPGAQAPRLRRALLLRRQERRARRPGERRCRLRARARAPCPTQATVQAAQARKQVPCSTRGRAARSGRARASWRPLSSSASRCACRRCSAGPSAPATRATSPSASTAAPATRASASPLSWHSAGIAERTTCARALCNPPLWRWRASKLCASPCRFVRIAQHAVGAAGAAASARAAPGGATTVPLSSTAGARRHHRQIGAHTGRRRRAGEVGAGLQGRRSRAAPSQRARRAAAPGAAGRRARARLLQRQARHERAGERGGAGALRGRRPHCQLPGQRQQRPSQLLPAAREARRGHQVLRGRRRRVLRPYLGLAGSCARGAARIRLRGGGRARARRDRPAHGASAAASRSGLASSLHGARRPPSAPPRTGGMPLPARDSSLCSTKRHRTCQAAPGQLLVCPPRTPCACLPRF